MSEASAFSSAVRSRAGSSGTIANISASPPDARTIAAMEWVLMSLIRPGGGASLTGTISSPVEMRAAFGLRYTGTCVMPSPARRPMSWGCSRFPAGITHSPRATSSAFPRTFSPAVTGLDTSIAPSPAGPVHRRAGEGREILRRGDIRAADPLKGVVERDGFNREAAKTGERLEHLVGRCDFKKFGQRDSPSKSTR